MQPAQPRLGSCQPIQPGRTGDQRGPGNGAKRVELPYRGSTDPGNFSCTANVQGFLELDREVTDTWAAAPAGTESGPSPGEEEMAAIIDRLAGFEAEIAEAGDWTRAGIFEDVRSDNYPGLVTGATPIEPFEPAEIVRLCSMEDLSDQLRAVVWEEVDRRADRGPGESQATAVLGVFHRSSVDGRWRWVHTAVRLDLASTCDEATEADG